jgi:beta-barrel assembly-enhancing protease
MHIKGGKILIRFLRGVFLCHLCVLAACSTPHYDSRGISSEGIGPPPFVRLHDVAFPLLVAAEDWCPLDQEQTYGFLIVEVTPANGQIDVESGQGVSVAYVYPQSPAASAGVMPRDRLIRRMTVARILPLQPEVVREGLRHTLSLMAVPACKFSVQLVESDQINGIADSGHIGMTTGAVKFVGSEDELTWVVAHEIVHNELNHSQNAWLRAMLNTFLRATTGASGDLACTMPPRRFLEARADYVGAYIVARAGYDVRAIKQFWRRLERLPSKRLHRR